MIEKLFTYDHFQFKSLPKRFDISYADELFYYLAQQVLPPLGSSVDRICLKVWAISSQLIDLLTPSTCIPASSEQQKHFLHRICVLLEKCGEGGEKTEFIFSCFV